MADGEEESGRKQRRREADATLPSAPPHVVLFREPDDEPRSDSRPLDEAPTPFTERVTTPVLTHVLAVAGAKGGVGTSMLAANLALYLASIGRRTVLVDADPAGSNLHTFVGVQSPRLPSARGGLPPHPVETPVQGLRLLFGGLDEGLSGKRSGGRKALRASLEDLAADWLVIDLGTSTSRGAIDAFLDADIAVHVTSPEPTAIEATNRFLRRAFERHLLRGVRELAARRALAARARALGGAPAPLDLWRLLEDDGDPLAELVRDRMEGFHPAVVLNQTRVRSDLELGEATRTAARRRLGITIDYLGHVEHDDTVWSCVRSQRLLLIESPGTKASKNVEKIARRILALQAGKRMPPRRTVPPESHHDILEVERGATDEDVRRAFKRARDIYADGSLACYGLFERHELEILRGRLEEAYDVLLDPARRRPYELSVFPPDEILDEPLPELEARLEPLPKAPIITPDTDFTGALLRSVRESQGVRLEEVGAKTKVGLPYLRALEEDDFANLPAPVYVRGFTMEFAKFLKLDAAQVSRTYARRYRRWLEDRERRA